MTNIDNDGEDASNAEVEEEVDDDNDDNDDNDGNDDIFETDDEDNTGDEKEDGEERGDMMGEDMLRKVCIHTQLHTYIMCVYTHICVYTQHKIVCVYTMCVYTHIRAYTHSWSTIAVSTRSSRTLFSRSWNANRLLSQDHPSIPRQTSGRANHGEERWCTCSC